MAKMKARIAPSNYDVQRRNEACWQEICVAQATSNGIMLVAVKRHFGLGAKRMRELCETFEDVRREFDEYEKDGVLIQKISDELAEAGIDTTYAWDLPKTFEEVRQECRMLNKPVINVGEAKGIREAFDGFKWFMEHQKEQK